MSRDSHLDTLRQQLAFCKIKEQLLLKEAQTLVEMDNEITIKMDLLEDLVTELTIKEQLHANLLSLSKELSPTSEELTSLSARIYALLELIPKNALHLQKQSNTLNEQLHALSEEMRALREKIDQLERQINENQYPAKKKPSLQTLLGLNHDTTQEQRNRFFSGIFAVTTKKSNDELTPLLKPL